NHTSTRDSSQSALLCVPVGTTKCPASDRSCRRDAVCTGWPAVRFGIRTKLLASFAIVAVLNAALSWHADLTVDHLLEQQQTQYADHISESYELSRWIEASWHTRIDLF